MESLDLTKREQVWLAAWTAVARSGKYDLPSSINDRADACLKAFDAKFRAGG
jgi:hypothetical protein